MSDEPITRDVPVQAPAAQALRQLARRRACRSTVTVQADGTVIAGGCKVGRVEAGADGGAVLVVRDTYWPRCRKRGSEEVAINVAELAEAARQAVEREPDSTKT